MPNGVKEVQYAPVKSINFIGKKQSLTKIVSLDFMQQEPHVVPRVSAIRAPEHEETMSFLAL